MGVGGVVATTEGATMSGATAIFLWFTQDSIITHGYQKLASIDEEAYCQVYDYDSNLGPFYDDIEDE